jgi:hypothetical protein
MPGPELLTETLQEGTTGFFSFPLVDKDGNGISLSFLTTMTLTYYDVESGEIVNNRLHQNVLNANNVTVNTESGPPLVTTVTFELTPADTVILNEAHALEHRVMLFQWTWNTGSRSSAYQAQFGVENMLFAP